MHTLLQECEHVMLIQLLLKPSNAFELLLLSQEHGLRILYQNAREICLSEDVDKIQKSKFFQQLNEKNKLDLLFQKLHLQRAEWTKDFKVSEEKVKNLLRLVSQRECGCFKCGGFDNGNCLKLMPPERIMRILKQ